VGHEVSSVCPNSKVQLNTAVHVQLIAKPDSGMTGTSRYTVGLHQALQAAGLDVRLTFPTPAPIPGPVQRGLKRIGLDAEAFFGSYPLRAELDNADVYHLTSQTLATLLWFQGFPAPVVVTVHDIIPYLVRRNPMLNTLRHVGDLLFYRLALIGLRRADALIAVSESTKRTLIKALGLPPERICVIYEAVDHEKFQPMAVPDPFRAKYRLDKGWRYVLYVGSDDPRKNLRTLVQAFALVRQQVEDAKLLKVGSTCFAQEQARLLSLVAKLGLQEYVLFFNHVPDEDLPLFYNVSDVFVMPSLYEGFGLPMLEAMACGRPVIASDRGSLPEVGGNAVLTVNPTDVEMLAAQITYLLEDREYAHQLGQAGYQRAQTFQPVQQAEATLALYERVEQAR